MVKERFWKWHDKQKLWYDNVLWVRVCDLLASQSRKIWKEMRKLKEHIERGEGMGTWSCQ